MTILSFIASLCVTAAVIFLGFCAIRFKGRIDSLTKYVAELIVYKNEIDQKYTELAEKFKAADELIEAAKEREEECARSEKLFQDGFASVFNYDCMTATKGKNGNGER